MKHLGPFKWGRIYCGTQSSCLSPGGYLHEGMDVDAQLAATEVGCGTGCEQDEHITLERTSSHTGMWQWWVWPTHRRHHYLGGHIRSRWLVSLYHLLPTCRLLWPPNYSLNAHSPYCHCYYCQLGLHSFLPGFGWQAETLKPQQTTWTEQTDNAQQAHRNTLNTISLWESKL